jgi:hypothetical protein
MSKLSLSVEPGYVSIAAHKRAKKATRRAHITGVRGQLFPTDHAPLCVCCLGRRAQSMHEIRSAGAVGSRLKAVSLDNSVPVCGSGTTGCHGHLQKHQIIAVMVEGVRTYDLNPRYPSAAAARHLESGWAMFDKACAATSGPTHRMAVGL